MVTLLIAMKLGCLLYLKIEGNVTCDRFSAKRLTSSHSGIFRSLTLFQKKVFRFSAFLASFVKILSLSSSAIWLSRKKQLNSPPRLSSAISLSFKISTNLLIPCVRRYCQIFANKFSKNYT